MKLIETAYHRVRPFIHKTPILNSTILDRAIGHRISFKWEGVQKTGAFKVRGAFNTLLSLKEKGQLPKDIISFSSGNHAQAVAYASATLGVNATIVMPKTVSSIKAQATKAYGANVILTETRQDAEEYCYMKQREGVLLIPPFDHNDVMQGQGTACYEALAIQGVAPTAIFVPCGGGGLASGTVMAAKELTSKSRLFAVEPFHANDAVRSLKSGTIFKFQTTPDTLADGARTLSVSHLTFPFLQQLDQLYEATEADIVYWTQWLSHLLKITVEPTSAMSMVGVVSYLKQATRTEHVLVILTGGNIDQDTYFKIWKDNFLSELVV